MLEVEIKVGAELEKVRKKLHDLDAEKQIDKTQVDTYFTAPHRDFAETDEALRLRVENGEPHITYKGPKIDSETKSREEFETVSKKREVYAFKDVKVVLDSVEELGEFVEVEKEVEKEGFEDARREVTQVIEELGLNPDDSIRKSYLGLLIEKKV